MIETKFIVSRYYCIKEEIISTRTTLLGRPNSLSNNYCLHWAEDGQIVV